MNKGLCKSCGNVVSFSAKTCPRCGDTDPLNKKAIQSIASLLKIKYSMLYIFFGSLLMILIFIMLYHYVGTKRWYMIFVIPLIIGVILGIVEEKLKAIDQFFDERSYFFEERLKLSDLIKVSLEGFIDANCEELNKRYHISKDNSLAYRDIFDILTIYVEYMHIRKRITPLDIIELSVYDIENIINERINTCKKNTNINVA